MLEFEWDETKAHLNKLKHDVRFEEAIFVFSDPHALEMEDNLSGEKRFIILGLNPVRGLLVVVYCERSEGIVRIISARKATKTERSFYAR